ncbi:MAG: serine hydrolase domain-containing protein [Saprospiraceae bacterium]|nr:beta-lactamase family protein [Saprospiraceae bacterium]MCB9344843.1 beta-lactamase family protein [Lewinellaceae bacterium]
MNLFRIILISALFFVFACGNKADSPADKQTELDASAITKIDSIGQKYLGSGLDVMGINIAIARHGKLVYQKGFGYIDSVRTKPVSNDQFFLLASISKLVTATMVMKLVEEKKLSLDNTLFELLPDYPNEIQAKKITVRHLLTHTSGLKDYAQVIDSAYIKTGAEPVKEDYYQFFRENDLDFEPGTNFNYSNSGFRLLAMIIEKLSGNTYADELDRIINNPSGLSLKLIAERAADEKTTSIFNFKDGELVYEPHWTWIKGDGGLTATAGDLALFPFYWSDGTLISKASYNEMCTPAKLSNGVHTGYGLGVRTGKFEGEKCVGHTGGNISTWAVMKYYPELETSVVVMVNTDGSPADALIIEGFVSLAMMGKSVPDLTKNEMLNFEYQPYLGDYKTIRNLYYGSRDMSVVKYEDDPHLYLYRIPNVNYTKGLKLYYKGGHEFAYDEFPMDRIIFEADSTGQIKALNSYWNGLRKGGMYVKYDQ